MAHPGRLDPLRRADHLRRPRGPRWAEPADLDRQHRALRAARRADGAGARPDAASPASGCCAPWCCCRWCCRRWSAASRCSTRSAGAACSATTLRRARAADRVLHHRGGDGADLRGAAVPGGQPGGRAAHGRASATRRSPRRSGARPTTVLRRVTLPLVLPGLAVRRGAVLRPRAGRVRRHAHLRRQPAGRHPHPAAGDLPAARDRPGRRRRPVAGAGRGRGRRGRRSRSGRRTGRRDVALRRCTAPAAGRGTSTSALELGAGRGGRRARPERRRQVDPAVAARRAAPARRRPRRPGRARSCSTSTAAARAGRRRTARGVALLAQEPLLFPHLSVLRRTSRSGRAAAGVGRRRGARGRPALAGRGRRRPTSPTAGPAELSGGQAQRVADRPGAGRRPAPAAARRTDGRPRRRGGARRCGSCCAGCCADRTRRPVTHDLLDALLLADRVVVLDGGRIVEARPHRARCCSTRGPPFTARIAGLNLVAGTADGARRPAARRDRGRRGRPGAHHPRRARRRRLPPRPRSSVFLEHAARQPAQRLRGHRHASSSRAATRSGSARPRRTGTCSPPTSPRPPSATSTSTPAAPPFFAVKATAVTVYPS